MKYWTRRNRPYPSHRCEAISYLERTRRARRRCSGLFTARPTLPRKRDPVWFAACMPRPILTLYGSLLWSFRQAGGDQPRYYLFSLDRKIVVDGKSGSACVDTGGRRHLKNTTYIKTEKKK